MRPFKAHPLLPGGQLQTLAGSLLGSPPSLAPSAEKVPLPDGDELLLHVDSPTKGPDRSHPLVLMLHGLGGCSESSYLLRLSTKLTGLGYTALRFNHRGCGRGGSGLARGIYHAGRTQDLAAALRFIEKRWPDRDLAVVAFSLSGNLLLRFLGEAGAETPSPRLKKAMAVCPPIDLELCSQALSSRANWHIDRYFTGLMLRLTEERSRHFPELAMPAYRGRLSLRRFDELYTAPKGGYPNREAYYAQASARPVVHRLAAVPVTVLAAADDPIIPEETFAGVRWGPAAAFRLERSGGHMGFISAETTRFGDRRWMEATVVDWVVGA